MTLTVQPGGAFALALSAPQEARMVEAAAKAYAVAKAEQDALAKVYTLKELPERLGISRTTLLKYLAQPVERGGIRSRRAGTAYLVSEEACREWLGDTKKEGLAA